MASEKPWYTSKTILGSLVALIAIVGVYFGFDISEQVQADIVDNILMFFAALGNLAAIYGRLVADTTIR